MLSVREIDVLERIIEFCKRIEEKIENITKKAFDINQDLNDIVCFNIIQIGETANKLSKAFVEKYNQQPWGDIVGMRNIIVHSYGSVNGSEVWKCATTEIKPLRDYCELILQNNK